MRLPFLLAHCVVMALLALACGSAEKPPLASPRPEPAPAPAARPEASDESLSCEERLARRLRKAKKADSQSKLALYEQACAAQCSAACLALGLERRLGRDVPEDRAAAKLAYATACELGDGNGCAAVGELALRQGATAEALQRFTQGCELGGGAACAGLAELHKLGRGVPIDPSRALELYERGCELSSGAACAGAARMIEWQATEDATVERLDRKAVELETKRCDARDPFACARLGDAYRDGHGVSKDPRRARQLYQTSCDAEVMRGCDGLKSLAP